MLMWVPAQCKGMVLVLSGWIWLVSGPETGLWTMPKPIAV